MTSKQPGDKMIKMLTNADRPSISDYPGFEWLSPKNFVGTKKINAVDCLVFTAQLYRSDINDIRMTSAPTSDEHSPDEHKITVVAVVDAKTRLPVELRIGDDRRTYTVSDPPAEKLVIPPDFLALEREAVKSFQRVIHPVGNP